MNDTWFTSDTHFFHKNILNFCSATRPFESVEEMNEGLIQKWNENIKPHDEVYHLGDFSFGKKELTASVLERLNGQIHLVRGNHDSQFDSNLKDYLTSMNWYKAIPRKRFGHKMFLMHFPIECWDSMEYGSIMLHGHLHGDASHDGVSVKPNRMDVGIDTRMGYTPYHIDEILLKLKG